MVSIRLLQLLLQFFVLVDAHCELSYLELRPLVFLKGQLGRIILFRTLPTGARRKTFLSLLHGLRPCHPLYLQDYLHSNVVYLRFHPHRQAYYIGSSILSLFDREMSRKRKYRQLCSGITAYYEPALRYWKLTRTFFQHAVIPLQLTSDSLTTRSTEISFQQHYRPQLNHPWINPLLRRHGLHVPQYNIPTTCHGPIGMTRLHRHSRRLERHHAQECILDLHLLKTLDVLHLLHRLGSDTKEKFYTSQVLRSHSTSSEILYFLWSQHFHIDEPWRSRAAAQLKLIFRFRKLMIPPTQATLRLFQLSHGFLQRCRQQFRGFLRLHSHLFPPLQVPASPIIEVKSHTLEHYLFNFRAFLRQWNPSFSPQCSCQRIRQDYRRHPDSGHIGFASDLFPGLMLSEAHLQDTVWPDERHFLNHSVTQMERWLHAWHLPSHLHFEWQHFFRQEWDRHAERQTTHNTGWSSAEVSAFRRFTKGFIVGPGDHFPHTAILSCPCHYHHLLLKTFMPAPATSTPVFQPLRHGIQLIRTRLRDTWPPHLLQRYRWGLHWDRRLPSAYILPKHSRDWSKARPIVSYTQTACAPLSQTVASAIFCLLQIVFPELTALSDVLPLLRRIWKILQQHDPTDDLILFQQDIAGFFNFVTHPRMVSTVEFLVSRYASLQGLDLQDDPILSLAQHQQERLQRVFRGRWRKTSRAYHSLHLRDLPDLVFPPAGVFLLYCGPSRLPTMSRSLYGFTFGTGSVQCCRTISGILLSPLLSKCFLALRRESGLASALRRQCVQLDPHICSTPTPSRPLLNLSFMADHSRWSMSQRRHYLALPFPLLNALLPFDNHLTSH